MSIQKKLTLLLGVWAVSQLAIGSAHAFGPKPPSPTPDPVYSLPNPKRPVIVRPFQNVHAFELPNQVTTTLDDAQSVLTTDLKAAALANGFQVVEGGEVNTMDPCGTHLELWPAVTDFTMEAMSAGIQFGFNATGAIHVNEISATASDTVSVGNIGFVVQLYQCSNAAGGSCQGIVAVMADQTVLGNHFNFNVNYQSVSVGGDIFNKTDLGVAVQTILGSGMKTMATKPEMAQVPWRSVVAALGNDGSVTFLAGNDAGIKTRQYFTVYAAKNATTACGAFEALDCIATQEVDGPSSVATVYKKLSAGASRPIQIGDVVEVGAPSCSMK